MNQFQLRIRHQEKFYRSAMHVLAVLFPVWGVLIPVTLALFVVLLLRLPANLHWLYALEIIIGLVATSTLCAFVALVCDDDALRITQEGIQFPLRFAVALRGKLFRTWDELAVLKLRWSGSIEYAPSDFLGLVFNDGAAMSIKLLQFDRTELQQLLAAVKNCGKKCELDPEFTLLARTSLLAASADNISPVIEAQRPVFGEFGLRYGARSVLSRWFSEYWTPLDRMLAPWIMVGVLGSALIWGPNLLLFLVGFLPIDQLGNSGASVLAHNMLLAIAAAAAALTTFALIKPLFKPSHLIISPDGIQKIWDRGLVLRGTLLPWNKIISGYVLSSGRITDNCRLVFATAQNARAFSFHNAHIPDDGTRKLLSEALTSLATDVSLAPDVFDVLIPCRALSLTEIWDAAIATTEPSSANESDTANESNSANQSNTAIESASATDSSIGSAPESDVKIESESTINN